MRNIIDFLCSRINKINESLAEYDLKKNNNINFDIWINEKKNEKLEITFLGSGTYGNVLQVKNMSSDTEIIDNGESIVMKIMKVKNNEEPNKCLQIKQKINRYEKYLTRLKNIDNKYRNKYKLSDSIVKKLKIVKDNYRKHKEIVELLDNYIMKILSVKKCKNIDIIFMKYVDGYDLKSYINNESLNQKDLDLVYLQCLLSVRIFHKYIGIAHRDLKLENVFIDKETKLLKLIDFGFICDNNDSKCVEKYQGTGKYTHPKFNKKVALEKRTLKNSLSVDNSVKYNKVTRKKQYNYPDAFSQDFFALLMIGLRLYYDTRKVSKGSSSKLYIILEEYDNKFEKKNDKYLDKKKRYRIKIKLIKELLKLKMEDIKHPSLSLIVKIFQKYWSLEKNDFMIDGKRGNSVINLILDRLILDLSNIVKNTGSISIRKKSIREKVLSDIEIVIV